MLRAIDFLPLLIFAVVCTDFKLPRLQLFPAGWRGCTTPTRTPRGGTSLWASRQGCPPRTLVSTWRARRVNAAQLPAAPQWMFVDSRFLPADLAPSPPCSPQAAYERLQAGAAGGQGPQPWRLLLLLRAQCVLFRRAPDVLQPFK